MELYLPDMGRHNGIRKDVFKGAMAILRFATKLRRNQSIWEKVKYVPLKQFIPVQQSEHVIQQKVSTKSLLVR